MAEIGWPLDLQITKLVEGTNIEEICAPGANGDGAFLADSRSQTALAGGAGVQVHIRR
jgi:hypothetical protein